MSAAEIRSIELDAQRDTLQTQYRLKCRLLQARTRGRALVVYANQATAANEIIAQFMSGKVWVVLVAPPGAGKTGVILEVLRQLGGHANEEHQIHIRDMLVITGMSDTEWTKTMRDGMLDAFEPAIHHRGMLRRKVGMDSMRDGIIVTDECHVAAQANQTIDKKLVEAGLKDIETLRRRNMRMLDVSATPEGVLHDLSRWREHTAVVVLQPDENYQGFQKMINEGRLLNASDYDLKNYEAAKALLKAFQDRWQDSPTKKYFPARVYSPVERANLMDAGRELGGWNFENHDSVDRVEDIDARMENAPTNHTMFFVKGFWRASKRLVRKHVGGSYEAPTTRPDDTAKSQGLTARFCSTFEWKEDNGREIPVAMRPLHFDDVESIKRYLAWWAHDCNYEEVAYRAPRMRSDGEGTVTHPKTKARPEDIAGVEYDKDSAAGKAVPVIDPKQVPIIIHATEAEYKTIVKKREWDLSSIIPIIKKYNPKIVETLLSIAKSGGRDQIYQPNPESTGYEHCIVRSVKAHSLNKRYHHVGNIKDKTKDTFQIYLDSVEHRIIINIYRGANPN